MINNYSFDNANAEGNKEAVILPNAPTLVNKLSANETNKFKDKINEIVEVTNNGENQVVPFFDLRLKFKGSVGGVPNTDTVLEIGDIVQGFKIEGDLWQNAVYNGGDPSDRANYTPISNGLTILEVQGTNEDLTVASDLLVPNSNNYFKNNTSADVVHNLPAIIGNESKTIIFVNKSNFQATLTSDGTDEVWYKVPDMNLILPAKTFAILRNDGFYWTVISTDIGFETGLVWSDYIIATDVVTGTTALTHIRTIELPKIYLDKGIVKIIARGEKNSVAFSSELAIQVNTLDSTTGAIAMSRMSTGSSNSSRNVSIQSDFIFDATQVQSSSGVAGTNDYSSANNFRQTKQNLILKNYNFLRFMITNTDNSVNATIHGYSIEIYN